MVRWNDGVGVNGMDIQDGRDGQDGGDGVAPE